jgi:hypothetical protein
MSNPFRVNRFALGILITAACVSCPARAGEHAGSKTVVGQTNPLLADGAAALEAGHVAEGVRLTLEGLKAAVTVQENAAGHSNACAGYILLEQWAEALVHCNAALEQARKVVPS